MSSGRCRIRPCFSGLHHRLRLRRFVPRLHLWRFDSRRLLCRFVSRLFLRRFVPRLLPWEGFVAGKVLPSSGLR